MKYEQAIQFFRRNQNFILTAHETPDGDAVGSESALYFVLEKMGKNVSIINADEMESKYNFLNEDGKFKTLQEVELIEEDLSGYVLIILDTNDIDNIGQVSEVILPYVHEFFIIDHHENEIEYEANKLIRAEASSTSEIIYDLIKEMNIELDREIAQALYTGIIYDTGSFIYPKTTAKTFRIAEHLVVMGVVPNDIYSKIYESNSISALVLQSKVLSSLELYFDNQVAVQTMLKETILECDASYEEAQTFINVPMKSEQVKVSLFFKENLEGVLRCSLRSKGNINVAIIAQTFGGGGHKTAAGFKCKKELAITKKEVLQELQQEYFTDQKEGYV
jgi:phosphoesterase RecJ-like protein